MNDDECQWPMGHRNKHSCACVCRLPRGHKPKTHKCETDAANHVTDILFEAQSEPEADCLLCQLASRLRLWQNYGFDDTEVASR